jgi:acyl-CoA thioesterase
MRLAEPRVADAVVLTAMSDAWPPSIFARVRQPMTAPTLDLTVHFRRALPAPGALDTDHVLGVFRSRLAHEGFFEEDGELWSRDGVLLAQSRQLAMASPISGER